MLENGFYNLFIMSQSNQISKAVISRLPRYYRYLRELIEAGTERISSEELSRLMKATASQIRQDLNHFGGFGQQGYEVPDETSGAIDWYSRKKEHVIREDKHGLCTGSKYDYFHLQKWDGQPIWADHMD